MVYVCTTEIKSDDVGQWSRVESMTSGAYIGSIVALWKTHVDE